jgi:hypothetical protein
MASILRNFYDLGVDPNLDTFYGPYPINKKNGTVTVPVELRREIGMETGDRVQWVLNRDIPGTLVLIPARRMAQLTDEILARLRETGG